MGDVEPWRLPRADAVRLRRGRLDFLEGDRDLASFGLDPGTHRMRVFR